VSVVDAAGSCRIGLLYPTRDCGEDDFVALAARLDRTVTVEFGYVPWGESVERLEDLDAEGRRAAVRELGEVDRLLASAAQFTTPPDVLSWTCSSCSFLWGLQGAEEQARALQCQTGAPASSTSLAFLAVLDRLGLRRVGLGSVYHPDVTAAFMDFLAAAGVSTVHAVSRDAPSDRVLAAWTPEQIVQLARDADHEAAQAVLIPETALHTTELLGELEQLLGKPVLTATAVTIWQALDQLGRHPTHSGLGTLFRG
jgi:maleate cis-trans isomerase